MMNEREGSWRIVASWLHAATFLFVGVTALVACSNNPYPDSDNKEKVLYLHFITPPKTLDPAVSYGTADTVVTNKVHDTLLEYDYLKRPYQLMPSMAEAIPEPEPLADGRVRYTFRLRKGMFFQEDVCFSIPGSHAKHGKNREVVASDFVFEIQRVGDPQLASQVVEPLSNLTGFREFSNRLAELRKADPKFKDLPILEQYERAGPLSGAVATDPHTLVVTLNEAYPQILYWFAMPVMTPVPWEAAEYYDGSEGRVPFSEHPISTGPYLLSEYEKQSRMVLVRNPHWWGLSHRDAPGTVFPQVGKGSEWDDMRALVGKELPLVDRIEYRREQETIPAFNKFIQGYYDSSKSIVRESFDRVIHEGGLSPEMKAKGMLLSQSVDPAVYYIGFNMDDPVIGRAGGDRSKKLRQAMSLAIDVREYLRLFTNGRGLSAQSPIPPGVFGYDEAYKNPFRQANLEKARQVLNEAGLKDGIDPATNKPVSLTFDVSDTSPEGRVRFMFWVNQWRKLGLDVQLDATNYNQFYAKMLKGSYQIYIWGWMADYPDPENFLFLLTEPMARSVSGGPNNANFKNAEYDRLFGLMRTRKNDDERFRIIAEMRGILEQERPWIELYYPESYALVHGWLGGVRTSGLTAISATKYYDLDPQERTRLREEWNKPIYWPAFVLLALVLALLVPGILTYYRERT